MARARQRSARSGRGALAGWALTIALAAAGMVSAWWWRTQLLLQPSAVPGQESWEQVKADFPLPHESVDTATVPEGMLDGIIRANPFDAERRNKPPDPAAVGGQSAAVIVPPAPRLVYKGRVHLGNRQRAILEDATAHKTYFLEVGQEVAGCKLLDIQETQVILSTLQTQEQVVVSLAATGRSSVPDAPAKHVGSP